MIVRFPPRESRYVRVTSLGAESPGAWWSVAEFFVYEAATAPWPAPPAATAALAAATRELDHWMDDPTGPHPLRAPVTGEHRRAQVPWGRAFAAANGALAAAPDWEEAHHLYGSTLARAGWGAGLETALDRARRDGAWQEVVRLAELIDAEPDAGWRAGRLAAWAEALEQLGRPAEAAAIRARPEPVAARNVRVDFGGDLLLIGIDGPSEAHPGDTVRLTYHWRLLDASGYDYWVFLHIPGLPAGGNHDRPVGGPRYGVSRWAPGERVRQTVWVDGPARHAPRRLPPAGWSLAPLHGAAPPDSGIRPSPGSAGRHRRYPRRRPLTMAASLRAASAVVPHPPAFRRPGRAAWSRAASARASTAPAPSG